VSYGKDFSFILFTNEPALAQRADEAGITRIGVDLEQIGKTDRQNVSVHRISNHLPEDLVSVAAVIRNAELFARTNPIHSGSEEEINSLILHGAQVLMLPFFSSMHEAHRFIELVGGRARTCLLVETVQALALAKELSRLEGVDELHFGLNDLHLQMKLPSHFHVLADGHLDNATQILRECGMPFGIGGIGRVNDSSLPMPPRLVYAQLPRLGASQALISRVYLSPDESKISLKQEIAASRALLDSLAKLPPSELHEEFAAYCSRSKAIERSAM